MGTLRCSFSFGRWKPDPSRRPLRSLDFQRRPRGKQIRELEKQFGTRLLNRSTRSQSLTEVGRLYYEQCKRALAEAEAAEAILSLHGRETRGTLRIAAPVAFASNHLAPLLSEFIREFPNVGVDLTVTSSSVDMIEQGYDFAFRIGKLPNSALNVRTLAPHRFIVCASKNYLDRRGTPLLPEDLRNHECLGIPLSSTSSRNTWQFNRRGKTHIVSVAGLLRINDERTLVDAAIAGAGIFLGCRSSMSAYVREGRLVRLLPEYDIPSLPINVLFAARAQMPRTLRTFLDWIVAKSEERSRRNKLADA